jgi:GNAT superfamily N-acetyltransferase
MTTTEEAVLMREFASSDTAYMMSTWLRDLRDADPSPLPDDLYFPAVRALIERLMGDPQVRCTIAAAADEPREILGYVVAIPKELVIWTHVRKGLRGRGLAKLLLQRADCPPGTPAAWGTALGKIRLRNPPRGRQVRGLPPFTAAKSGS